jgi:protein O-GlcNAc transferase
MERPATEAERKCAEGFRYSAEEDWAAALQCFTTAAALEPDFAAYLNNAGVAAWKCGRIDSACDYLHSALRLDPANGDYHFHLGRVLESAGDWEGALRSYAAALQALDAAKVHHRLGLLLSRAGRYSSAARAHRAAIDRDPNYSEAWHALAVNLCSMRDVAGAYRAWERALELAQEFGAAASQRFLSSHYVLAESPEDLFRQHREWGRGVEARTPRLPPSAFRHNRLRIGYLSPDLGSHAVSFFMEPLLRHHDRNVVEVFCFFDGAVGDSVPRLRPLADHWRDVRELDNTQLATCIRANEIDVLVDVAGHTHFRDRFPVLASGPAPLQITSIGYPNTTGLSTVDFRLSDSISDPPGRSDGWYSEKLLRLDPCFVCYAPPEDAPELPQTMPVRPFTFGSFNALPKITDAVLDLWAVILARTPGTRLLLSNLELADPEIRSALSLDFQRRGIDTERIELRPPAGARRDHLKAYAEMDLALDTFPYNGLTTTCEALWMGVPVVTLKGDRHVARVGASLLACCGLERWVANSAEEYLAIALRASGDPPMCRARLRDLLRASALLDGDAYARRFEALLFDAFRGNVH